MLRCGSPRGIVDIPTPCHAQALLHQPPPQQQPLPTAGASVQFGPATAAVLLPPCEAAHPALDIQAAPAAAGSGVTASPSAGSGVGGSCAMALVGPGNAGPTMRRCACGNFANPSKGGLCNSCSGAPERGVPPPAPLFRDAGWARVGADPKIRRSHGRKQLKAMTNVNNGVASNASEGGPYGALEPPQPQIQACAIPKANPPSLIDSGTRVESRYGHFAPAVASTSSLPSVAGLGNHGAFIEHPSAAHEDVLTEPVAQFRLKASPSGALLPSVAQQTGDAGGRGSSSESDQPAARLRFSHSGKSLPAMSTDHQSGETLARVSASCENVAETTKSPAANKSLPHVPPDYLSGDQMVRHTSIRDGTPEQPTRARGLISNGSLPTMPLYLYGETAQKGVGHEEIFLEQGLQHRMRASPGGGSLPSVPVVHDQFTRPLGVEVLPDHLGQHRMRVSCSTGSLPSMPAHHQMSDSMSRQVSIAELSGDPYRGHMRGMTSSYSTSGLPTMPVSQHFGDLGVLHDHVGQVHGLSREHLPAAQIGKRSETDSYWEDQADFLIDRTAQRDRELRRHSRHREERGIDDQEFANFYSYELHQYIMGSDALATRDAYVDCYGNVRAVFSRSCLDDTSQRILAIHRRIDDDFIKTLCDADDGVSDAPWRDAEIGMDEYENHFLEQIRALKESGGLAEPRIYAAFKTLARRYAFDERVLRGGNDGLVAMAMLLEEQGDSAVQRERKYSEEDVLEERRVSVDEERRRRQRRREDSERRRYARDEKSRRRHDAMEVCAHLENLAALQDRRLGGADAERFVEEQRFLRDDGRVSSKESRHWRGDQWVSQPANLHLADAGTAEGRWCWQEDADDGLLRGPGPVDMRCPAVRGSPGAARIRPSDTRPRKDNRYRGNPRGSLRLSAADTDSDGLLA